MTDNITLPRAVVEQVREALESYRGQVNIYGDSPAADVCTILDAALAEPERHVSLVCPQCNWTLQEPEPDAKPEPTHPGYVIGAHWLETAYSRIAAGEAEDAVLGEVLGARGWAKREPATHGEISEKFYNAGSDRYYRQVDYRHGWRAAERFHGIRKEDK